MVLASGEGFLLHSNMEEGIASWEKSKWTRGSSLSKQRHSCNSPLLYEWISPLMRAESHDPITSQRCMNWGPTFGTLSSHNKYVAWKHEMFLQEPRVLAHELEIRRKVFIPSHSIALQCATGILGLPCFAFWSSSKNLINTSSLSQLIVIKLSF
jgi:hypothetical protein